MNVEEIIKKADANEGLTVEEIKIYEKAVKTQKHVYGKYGTLAKEYADAAKTVNPDCDVHYFADRESMTKELLSYVKEGDTILVKASHFMEFPKVVEALKSFNK